MNETIPDSLVEKIRKLLALASVNDNPNERELALSKAKAYCIEYEIDLASIEIFESKKKEEPILKNDQILLGKRESVCQKFVSWILGAHFNVKLIYHGGRYGEGKRLIIIGKKSDIEIATYVQGFLNQEMMRLWHEYRKKNPLVKTVERNSFLWGIYESLCNKLSKEEKQTEETVFEKFSKPTNEITRVKECYALAKIDNKKRLESAVESFYPRLKNKYHSYTNNHHSTNAREAGRQAGNNISLRKGISGGNGGQIKS